MTTRSYRSLCAATLLCALSSIGANAQDKAVDGIDPAVLKALGRDLKLAPQQVVERVTAEQDAIKRHLAVQKTLGTAYAGAWFDAATNTQRLQRRRLFRPTGTGVRTLRGTDSFAS